MVQNRSGIKFSCLPTARIFACPSAARDSGNLEMDRVRNEERVREAHSRISKNEDGIHLKAIAAAAAAIKKWHFGLRLPPSLPPSLP